ncbi:MAG: flagellar hook-associated protein FlgK [Proteobacteria bacterium]|nr:flagellar hook-associated protein FlgK [Pseudomonadota bacterium]
MSGYRITLDIAKGALAAAQNNLAVTGHNISNVSTDGYSRQTTSLAIADPMSLGGIQFGRGVTIESVQRQANEHLEMRLREQKSILAGDEQAVLYVDNLETLFDIQSENEVGSMIAEFWNTWQDLSNNPSGVSDRAVVYEYGNQLSERLNILNEDLLQLEDHINQEINTGVEQVNAILDKIAGLNVEINLQENLGKTANDQRDSRSTLVMKLEQMMSINTIDQHNGFLTILTDGGYPLVIDNESYHLKADGGRIIWPTSSGGEIDISDKVKSGKLSGWLDIKEEVVSKMRTQVDTLAKELIWQVNYVHSQGTGLSYLSTEQNGSYNPITSEGGVLSTLTYGHKIDYSKDFKMWTKDSNNPPNAVSVEVDMGISDTSLTYVGGAAGSTQSKYYFTVTTAGTVGPGDDDPVITWQTADYSTTPPGLPGGGGTVSIADAIAGNFGVDGMNFTIDPGYLIAGNTFTVNTDGAGTPMPLNVTNDPLQRANSVLDNYVFRVISGGGDVTGVSEANPMVIEWRNSNEISTITLDELDPITGLATVEVDGMVLTFGSGLLYNDDVFSISTDEHGFQADENGAFSLETSSQWHWTVDSFKDQFNTQSTASGAHVTAFTNLNGSLKYTPDYGYSYTFSDDQAEDSGLMAALGMNTFFEGDDASSITVKDTLEFVDYIAAARINGGDSNGMIGDAVLAPPDISVANGNNTFRFEENDQSRTVILDTVNYTTAVDLHSLASDIQAKMNGASTLGPPEPYKVVYDQDSNQIVISENDGSNMDNLEIFWSENPNTAAALGFQSLDKVYLPPFGDYGVSNNANSLAISELQYTDLQIAKWNFTRGQDNYSDTSNIHIEGSYQDMLSGLGVKGAALNQSIQFGDIMVEQLTQQRDTISGVSIDEEMVKLIAYQQSYTAASKLIRTVDEMLQTLMTVK